MDTGLKFIYLFKTVIKPERERDTHTEVREFMNDENIKI